MADNISQVLGEMAKGAFETVGRTESWAEQRTASAVIVGKFKDLYGKVKPGDSMANHADWFKSKWNGAWYVKNFDLASPDGITGELRMALVQCPQGKTKPFNVTWNIAMEEVQMKLINHPMIQENADIPTLLKWEDTPPSLRVQRDKNKELTFYYVDMYSAGGTSTLTPVKITGDWEIAYCLAVTQGIETYNRYLPVITKTTTMLELAGANYSTDNHQITGGTISEFTGQDVIGKFNEPDLKIAGYTGNKGVWFKSGDQITTQADGSAARVETWVFTNDSRHKWIYTNTLG